MHPFKLSMSQADVSLLSALQGFPGAFRKHLSLLLWSSRSWHLNDLTSSPVLTLILWILLTTHSAQAQLASLLSLQEAKEALITGCLS